MARGRHDYEKAVIVVESEGFANPHGRILMYDDFEDTPLKWLTSGTMTHSETRQHPAAYSGSFGLRLDVTPTAIPWVGVTTARRLIPCDVTKRILSEIFWRTSVETQTTAFDMQLEYYDGVRLHTAAIRYATVGPGWFYLDDAGIWVQMAGMHQRVEDNAWNELMFSVDFTTDEYITSKSNNLERNMGGIACQNVASGLGSHLACQIQLSTVTNQNTLADIDDVVIRELEV